MRIDTHSCGHMRCHHEYISLAFEPLVGSFFIKIATINIDFGDYRPDKITVFYDYLETTSKITPKLNMINETTPRKTNNSKQYSFTFYPNESAVYSDIIIGRVYKITVSVFVIINRLICDIDTEWLIARL